MAYQKPIYIVSQDGTYNTNRTNVARLWEVFEKEWGDKPLALSYLADPRDSEYTVVTGKSLRNRFKKLCKEAVNNRVMIYPEDDIDDFMSVFFDAVGGSSEPVGGQD